MPTQRGGGGQQQRAAARYHDAFAVDGPALLGQRLDAAGARHARQRPARKRQEQFARAGGQHH
jgi:hypothetical protein